jgi:hypothetical protein
MKYFEIILLFLLISCSSRSNFNKTESDLKSTDSLSLEYSIPDSSFHDFILQFGFNPDFQKLRIKFPLEFVNFESKTLISADKWINDRLYVVLESISDISNGLKVNEKSDERVFTWTHTDSHISKNYYFKKKDQLWYLLKIAIIRDSIDIDQEDFYSFLGKFCNDSIFQKQRIFFPLDMTYLDDDYNEVNESLPQDKWKFQGFYYDCDSVATLFYNFNKDIKDTDERILMIHGVENGISAQYTFKRVNKNWILIKHEDYST